MTVTDLINKWQSEKLFLDENTESAIRIGMKLVPAIQENVSETISLFIEDLKKLNVEIR